MCGKSPREAMEVTMREYRQLLWGNRERELREWRRARWEQFFQAQIAPFLKRRPRRPEEILPLENDPKREVTNGATTKAEQDALERIFEDFRRRRNRRP